MDLVATHGSNWGVSVVICCYNSSQRLPQTLGHLLAQECEVDLPWEVIVVDNASTDGTAEVARSVWSCDATTPAQGCRRTRAGTDECT
jgi:cellulose synthase/poly-beta-1,6-N-acetylglucosamine synthase-like glycosyltransferase